MAQETRYQRVAREQAERQARRAAGFSDKTIDRQQARARAATKRVQRLIRTEDSRAANHVDGLDRDDLGESDDY